MWSSLNEDRSSGIDVAVPILVSGRAVDKNESILMPQLPQHLANDRDVYVSGDEQLMERLKQGQTDALDELYWRYARRLHAFCANMTFSRSSMDPKDLVQEVFARVLKSARSFDPKKASFRTWMFRIARNHCIDAIRRNDRIRFIPIGKKGDHADGEPKFIDEETVIDPDENVERLAIRENVVNAVHDCISKLTNEDERQAIIMYYMGCKVYREIGLVLGKSTSMAKTRVMMAQEKVRECLEKKGIDHFPAVMSTDRAKIRT